MARKLWLCLPPALLCLIDHAVTLWGQPESYWRESFREPREGSPHGYLLLQAHPAMFCAAGVLWILAYSAIILVLPRRWSLVAMQAMVLGHAWGAGTWILQWEPWGYWICLCLFGAIAVVVVRCWELSEGGPNGRRIV